MKVIYGFLQLTGGLLMTFVGLIVTSFCILFLKGTPHKNGYSYIVEIGGNGGGLELGAVALCGRYTEFDPNGFEHTRRHEFGHSLQNIIFGPFMLFVVTIPSAIRYGYRRLTPGPHEPYDAIGFEGTATKGGSWAISKIESKDAK